MDAAAPMQTHGVTPPLVWNSTEVLAYVRKVVHTVIQKDIEDDGLIFEHGGVNSGSHATYIREALVHAVTRARNDAVSDIYPDFVPANPTIARLTERLLAIVNATPSDKSFLKLQEMAEMISQFSADFPEHRPTNSWKASPGEVVLLTGSTGSLGSYILAHLVSSLDVFHVYALNRRSRDGKSLRDRQVEAFFDRDLDVGIVDSPKVTLVEGDTRMNDLDIHPALFSEIRDNTTLIIHNAWRLGFISELASFKSNVHAVRTLVDLALGSPRPDPPRFIFTSSSSIFRNWDSAQGPPLEVSMNDPTISLGGGYGESKFVAERVLENAARSTSLLPIIVRLGQLTGSSNGVWSPTEWVPVIVLAGQHINVLPGRDDCITWISPKIAAEAVFDFRNSHSRYLHLAHPNPVPWNAVFGVFSSRLNVPLGSWSEWRAKLTMDTSYKGAKIFNMLDNYRECCHPGFLENREGPGFPMMDMQQALGDSPTLTNPSLPQISSDDAERWIRHWRKIGFLANDAAKL